MLIRAKTVSSARGIIRAKTVSSGGALTSNILVRGLASGPFSPSARMLNRAKTVSSARRLIRGKTVSARRLIRAKTVSSRASAYGQGWCWRKDKNGVKYYSSYIMKAVNAFDNKDLKEERIDGEVIFEGRIIRLERDRVSLPNGLESTREVVKHPGAVAIVALLDDKLLMVRQYRYPIAQETLEIPAGRLDPLETPLACAQRELREETGYRGTMEKISTYYSSAGFTDEVIHIFLARDLVWDPLSLDSDEFLGLESIPWDEAVRRAHCNDFNDSKTILGILLVQGRI
jgi:ADP-ribose pyrophosphatase